MIAYSMANDQIQSLTRAWYTLQLVALISILLVGVGSDTAYAHGTVGKRFFPTTFAIEDPFVSDEFSLLFGFVEEPAEGGEPAVKESELEVEFSKRITDRFALSFGAGLVHLDPDGASSNTGFSNVEFGIRQQILTLPEWETVATLQLGFELGDSGNRDVGVESFSVVSPGLFYGIGAGRLPESVSMFRPFAVSGFVEANVPTEKRSAGETSSVSISWGFAVQYSFEYLQTNVRDIGIPSPFDRFIAVVEFDLQNCARRCGSSSTSGSVNPGLIWLGDSYELGLSARIPINDASGDDPGVFVLLHFFLDDIFPNSLGRPLFHSKPTQ